jgi:predicted site-specific integrase-resolvase
MEQLVPIEDVAKHFKVSVSTARKWVRDSVIPENVYVKVGKTHRFSLPDVTEALMAYKSVRSPASRDAVSDAFDPPSFDPDADV